MKQLNVRLPDDLHARLREAAEQDRRSLNSEIIHLLDLALRARGADSPSP